MRLAAVRAVALAAGVPFSDLAADRANTAVSASTGAANGREAWTPIFSNRIGADYFRHPGRTPVAWFATSIAATGKNASQAILNQTAARALFGDLDPIGRHLREGDSTYTVVAVARDTARLSPAQARRHRVPAAHLRLVCPRHAPRATILVRGAPGPETLAILREHFASLHPDLTIFDVHTMRENLARNEFLRAMEFRNLHGSGAVRAAPGLRRPGRRDGLLGGAEAQGDRYPLALGARPGRPGQEPGAARGSGPCRIGSLAALPAAYAIARAASSIASQIAERLRDAHQRSGL